MALLLAILIFSHLLSSVIVFIHQNFKLVPCSKFALLILLITFIHYTLCLDTPAIFCFLKLMLIFISCFITVEFNPSIIFAILSHSQQPSPSRLKFNILSYISSNLYSLLYYLYCSFHYSYGIHIEQQWWHATTLPCSAHWLSLSCVSCYRRPQRRTRRLNKFNLLKVQNAFLE